MTPDLVTMVEIPLRFGLLVLEGVCRGILVSYYIYLVDVYFQHTGRVAHPLLLYDMHIQYSTLSPAKTCRCIASWGQRPAPPSISSISAHTSINHASFNTTKTTSPRYGTTTLRCAHFTLHGYEQDFLLDTGCISPALGCVTIFSVFP